MRITKQFAREIIEDNKGTHLRLLDNAISVCDYVSRQYKEELTITQGSRLFDLIEKEQKKNLIPDSSIDRLVREWGVRPLLNEIAKVLRRAAEKHKSIGGINSTDLLPAADNLEKEDLY